MRTGPRLRVSTDRLERTGKPGIESENPGYKASGISAVAGRILQEKEKIKCFINASPCKKTPNWHLKAA